MRRVGVTGAICFITGCIPSPDGPSVQIQQDEVPAPSAGAGFAPPRLDGEVISLAMRADAVVLAQLVSVDFSSPGDDGFLTTADWKIIDSIRGDRKAGEMVRVRFPLGREQSGDWRWIGGESAISPDERRRMKPGDTFLLMLSRDFYEQQARARSGRPAEAVTGAGFGFYRVEGGKILPSGSFEAPSTIQDFKAVLQRR